MKKLIVLALAAVGIFTVQAQEQAQDVKAIYEQGKNLEKVFDKVKANPDAEAAESLMKAFELYDQVMQAEANSPKPKYAEKIQKSLMAHTVNNDFQRAAIALFNGDKKYPQAYDAFMTSGMATQASGLLPDTVYAVDFYNAGNCAYGTDFEAAIAAYDAAINANITDPNAYVYAIGARQQLAAANPDKKEQYNKEISAIAEKGIGAFGYKQPALANLQDFLLDCYLQQYFDAKDFDQALAILAKAEQADPTNDNVYRLKGLTGYAKGDIQLTQEGFLKMGELSNNFDYLYSAADDINSQGKSVLGSANASNKQQIIDIFNNALKLANKALTVPEANADRVNYLIEDINYNIENANKL
ncbi:MAG: hypothetical protein NC217_01750 [Muribaculaceae bacterium]|nr:hypothetical protein [Muribaculaceae bacterium]